MCNPSIYYVQEQETWYVGRLAATCVTNILFKRTIKIPQQGVNLRLYMTNKFNLDTINITIISSAQKYRNCKNCDPVD
jgi:hypothetical protein